MPQAFLKCLATCAAAATALVSVAQQAGEQKWIADPNGCKVVNPRPRARESISWSGECVSGIANGEGRLAWFLKGKLTGTFTGTLVAGQLEGQGVYEYANGDRYEGEFYASRYDGRGVYTYANGNRYEGDFVAGIATRSGALQLTDGQRFKTDFVSGRTNVVADYMAPSTLLVVCFNADESWSSVTVVRSSGFAVYDDHAASIVKVRAMTSEELVNEPFPGCHMVGVVVGHKGYTLFRSRP